MRKGLLGAAFVYLMVLVSIEAMAFPIVPDPQKTPGSLCTLNHADYKEDRYQEKIPYCQRNVSSSTKKYIYRIYGIPSHCTKRYTIDHFIPLSIGGDNSVRNLWPEHQNVKATRKNLENELFREVQKGRMSQETAVDHIYAEKMNPPVPVSGSNECDRLDPKANWDLL